MLISEIISFDDFTKIGTCQCCMRLYESDTKETPVDFAKYNLQQKYQEYNRMFFDGKLPYVPIEFKKMKGKGGAFIYQIESSQHGNSEEKYKALQSSNMIYKGRRVIITSMRMEISNTFLRSEKEYGCDYSS